MAKYRQLYTEFWTDGFVLDLTPEEKYFYVYLMTNSKTTQCGIYELPKKVIETETGYNRETVDKLIKRFEEYNKISYCEATKEIMIIKWIKHNVPNNSNAIKCINKELREVKNIEFLNTFFDLCQGYGYNLEFIFKGLGRGLEGATKGLPSKEIRNNKEEIRNNKEEIISNKEEIRREDEDLSLMDESIEVCKYFETVTNGKSITGQIEQVKQFVAMYTKDWLLEAIDIAVTNGVTSLSYIRKVLQNWATDGKKGAGRGGGTRQDSKPSEDSIYDFSKYGG